MEVIPRRKARRGPLRFKPSHVIAPVIVYLAIAWILFFLIDAGNMFQLREVLARRLPTPQIWYYLFQEGGATEILQWIALAGASLFSGFLAGRLFTNRAHAPAMFWLVLGIGMAFMLIEDAGNPRHYLTAIASMTVAGQHRQTVTTIVELAYFTFLAGIPLYALLRYGRQPWQSRKTRAYLLLGFGAYGIAGFASGTRHIMEWYAAAGAFIHRISAQGQLPIPPEWDQYMLEFFLMDWLVEESVELLGAAAFLSATLAYLHELRKAKPGESLADKLPARRNKEEG